MWWKCQKRWRREGKEGKAETGKAESGNSDSKPLMTEGGTEANAKGCRLRTDGGVMGEG